MRSRLGARQGSAPATEAQRGSEKEHRRRCGFRDDSDSDSIEQDAAGVATGDSGQWSKLQSGRVLKRGKLPVEDSPTEVVGDSAGVSECLIQAISQPVEEANSRRRRPRDSGLGGIVGVGKGDCVERAGSGGEGLCESPMEVEHLGTVECRAGDEAIADGVAHLHVGSADNPGRKGGLAGIDVHIGGRIGGLKTSVDDELGVGGMDRSESD